MLSPKNSSITTSVVVFCTLTIKIIVIIFKIIGKGRGLHSSMQKINESEDAKFVFLFYLFICFLLLCYFILFYPPSQSSMSTQS